nr:uncharacterized protein LOC126538332 [Dermacentor andersoni]
MRMPVPLQAHARLDRGKRRISNSVPPKDNSARCSQPERLSVLLINCRSIKNKVDNFMSLVATVKPQIVMGTESWLDKDIPNVEIFPPGFTVYRKDRYGHGGVIFILISNVLSSTQILFENTSESVWCPMKLPNGNNVVYGTFYRPPGSSDSLGLLSEMPSLLPNSVFLGGDFNLPDFNWNAGCVAGNRSRIYTEFEKLVGLNGLQQYVLEPTRENAILDLVLCNEPNIITKVTFLLVPIFLWQPLLWNRLFHHRHRVHPVQKNLLTVRTTFLPKTLLLKTLRTLTHLPVPVRVTLPLFLLYNLNQSSIGLHVVDNLRFKDDVSK